MGKGNVWVDLAGEGGVPLFKKFAMFDSGFVPAERTCRDAALFRTLPDIISAQGFIYRRTGRGIRRMLRKHRRGSITIGRKRIGL